MSEDNVIYKTRPASAISSPEQVRRVALAILALMIVFFVVLVVEAALERQLTSESFIKTITSVATCILGWLLALHQAQFEFVLHPDRLKIEKYLGTEIVGRDRIESFSLAQADRSSFNPFGFLKRDRSALPGRGASEVEQYLIIKLKTGKERRIAPEFPEQMLEAVRDHWGSAFIAGQKIG